MKLKKRTGQALVEFVIILPIFIFMILAVVDIGKILYLKNNLETKIEDIITMYDSTKNQELIFQKLDLKAEKLDLKIKQDQEYLEFLLEKKVEIITPGLNLIFKNPYIISTKRVIPYEF